MANATYSFLDCTAAITGVGGTFTLGADSGNAEEGITISMAEDKGTLTMGADGSWMHSLHAGQGGTITVRLLKTSPVNQQLMQMYNAQRLSSSTWGANVISVRNVQTGDVITAAGAAFRKAPDISYAKVGNTVEWAFNCGKIEMILGSGTPEA